MEETITVIIDEEIIEKFGSAFWEHSRAKITPGVEAYKYGNLRLWYWEDAGWKVLFRNGRLGLSQYDEEFTEWLKEHRPEIFL